LGSVWTKVEQIVCGWTTRHRNSLIQREAGRMSLRCTDCGHVSSGVDLSARSRIGGWRE
jgi:uncharacterized Zn finger protein